jgi:hypothetical protein
VHLAVPLSGDARNSELYKPLWSLPLNGGKEIKILFELLIPIDVLA